MSMGDPGAGERGSRSRVKASRAKGLKRGSAGSQCGEGMRAVHGNALLVLDGGNDARCCCAAARATVGYG
jgi:hypothetical protein